MEKKKGETVLEWIGIRWNSVACLAAENPWKREEISVESWKLISVAPNSRLQIFFGTVANYIKLIKSPNLSNHQSKSHN